MNTQPVPVSQLLVWQRAIQGLFNQHPFTLLADLGERSEPILVFRVAGEKIYFFNEPDLVKEVLVTHHTKLQKGRGISRLKRTLGNGLLTSEGDLHRQQRRIIQPVFNHRNLQAYADQMVASASEGIGLLGRFANHKYDCRNDGADFVHRMPNSFWYRR